MIRYQEMVPDWYIEKSRDFQVLCHMYDFVMNGVKYNTDSMLNLTDTRRVKNTVLPLLGDKLGIYDREAYSNRQLLDALPIAIKYKGALKSIHVLLNAFLDSMNVFDTVLALYATNEEEAQEINDVLRRDDIVPFTIVIIFNTFPSLTNLHVLDEYMKMVIPTGMMVEYGFGVRKTYLDKFKYKEYVFLYYTSTRTYEDEPMTVPMIGMVKNTHHILSESVGPGQSEVKNTPVKKAMKNPDNGLYYKYKINIDGTISYSNELPDTNCSVEYVYDPDAYTSAFEYAGTTNVKTRRELVGDEKRSEPYVHVLKHKAVPVPPATDIEIYKVTLDANTGNVLEDVKIDYEPSGIYRIYINTDDTIVYLRYSFNKTEEFVDKLNEEGFDVNAVSIGTIMSRDQIEINNE